MNKLTYWKFFPAPAGCSVDKVALWSHVYCQICSLSSAFRNPGSIFSKCLALVIMTLSFIFFFFFLPAKHGGRHCPLWLWPPFCSLGLISCDLWVCLFHIIVRLNGCLYRCFPLNQCSHSPTVWVKCFAIKPTLVARNTLFLVNSSLCSAWNSHFYIISCYIISYYIIFYSVILMCLYYINITACCHCNALLSVFVILVIIISF